MQTACVIASSGRPERVDLRERAIRSVERTRNYRPFLSLQSHPDAWSHYRSCMQWVESERHEWMTFCADDDEVVAPLVGGPDVVAVCAFAHQRPDVGLDNRIGPTAILGPPVTTGKFNASTTLPLAPLYSWFLPPASILRTSAAAAVARRVPHDPFPLYYERVLFAEVATKGLVEVQPVPAAFYNLHPLQESRGPQPLGPASQWLNAFAHIAKLADAGKVSGLAFEIMKVSTPPVTYDEFLPFGQNSRLGRYYMELCQWRAA